MKPWGFLHGLCGFRKLEVEKQEILLKVVDTKHHGSKKDVTIFNWLLKLLKITSDTKDDDSPKQNYDQETRLEGNNGEGKNINESSNNNNYLENDKGYLGIDFGGNNSDKDRSINESASSSGDTILELDGSEQNANPSRDIEARIEDLEWFKKFLISDVIDISRLEAFK